MEPAKGEERILGELYYKKLTDGTTRLQRWRKKYWVVNHRERCLDYFKNDVATVKKGTLLGRDMTNVHVRAEKDNKAFFLTVTLRGGKGREFKMKSRELRDNCFDAVLKLMQSVRNDDQLANILSVVRQHTASWSKEFGAAIETDYASVADLPAAQYLPFLTALDAGADLIRRSLAAWRGKSSSVSSPFDGAVISVATCRAQLMDTRYDPAARRLHVVVLLDGPGAEPETLRVEQALDMFESTVWRDPQVEGFLELNPDAAEGAARIARLLGADKFDVSLQWSHDVSHSSGEVQSYVGRFVNAALLERVHGVVAAVCERFAQDAPNVRPAEECLRQYVTGVGLLLNNTVLVAERVPAVSLCHTMWQDGYLGPAFAILSRYRAPTPLRAPSAEIEDPLASLDAQLTEVVMHVRIADSCERATQAVAAALPLHDPPVIAWETLPAAIGPEQHRDDLHLLVDAIGRIYVERLQAVSQQLQRTGLLQTFQECVRCLKLAFVPNTVPDGEPAVEFDEFHESAILCAGDLPVDGAETTPAPLWHGGLHVSFAVESLGSWLRGHFATPGNRVPFVADRGGFEDDDDDADSEDGDFDVGDSAAVERTAESRFLTLEQVVQQVYDTQGPDLGLKVSADLIRAGLAKLDGAFPAAVISKHAMQRVLTDTLQRLRFLFATSSDGTGEVPRDLGIRLLSDYCEYVESEREVAVAVGDCPSLTFRDVGEIVLLWLMPIEAVQAMRSRRSVLIVGLERTGKSTILLSLRGRSTEPDPSIGVTTTVVPFQRWVLRVSEIGGRPEQRRTFPYFLQQCDTFDGVIFVVDAGIRASFPDAKAYLQQVLGSPTMAGLPCLLVCNNTQHKGSASVRSVTRALDFENVCGARASFTTTCDVIVPQSHCDPDLARGLAWLGQAIDTSPRYCNGPTAKLKDTARGPNLPR